MPSYRQSELEWNSQRNGTHERQTRADRFVVVVLVFDSRSLYFHPCERNTNKIICLIRDESVGPLC